jgi:hypothetical protein
VREGKIDASLVTRYVINDGLDDMRGRKAALVQGGDDRTANVVNGPRRQRLLPRLGARRIDAPI